MKLTRKMPCAPRPLPVEWIDDPAARWRPALRKGRFSRRLGRLPLGQETPRRSLRLSHGFTVLELMVVLAIIGFIAALALPHVSGFNRVNAVSAAERQLLDDIALARQRAMAGRSTVYMVFVPGAFYNNANGVLPPYSGQQAQQFELQISNLLGRQYIAYALIATRTIGDQPGRHYPHYLTDWRTLPDGIYISPFQFGSNQPPGNAIAINVTNTLANQVFTYTNYQLNWTSVPFPSVEFGVNYQLPYIGFTPQGTLTTTSNQFIMLTRGSILPAEDTNGAYIQQPPILTETPPGNTTNNPCLVQIDWLTARANIVQNQFK